MRAPEIVPIHGVDTHTMAVANIDGEAVKSSELLRFMHLRKLPDTDRERILRQILDHRKRN